MPTQFCLACLMPDTGFSVCPHCGWSKNDPVNNPVYLPPGTVVQPPYQVARVLGHGGFGITYLGWDANLQIKVAIKEYLPRDFAMRDPQSGQVISYGGDAEFHFVNGLQQFLDEARTLAKFQQHAGIVSVLTFFRAYGTGYMVMEYVEGETLRNYLKRGRVRLNWEQTLGIFMHIMDALRAVHAVGLLHRDIAPDNIYLCSDGRVKLLDFGAARQNLASDGRTLAIVKPGFAPEEQYRESGVQGAWSDVYSVAASMYYCLTGNVPPDAMARLSQDTLKSPSEYGAAISPTIEACLMAALSVRASQRPHTIADFQKSLLNAEPLAVEPISKPQPQISEAQRQPLPDLERFVDLEPEHLPLGRWLLVSAVAFLVLFVAYKQLGSSRLDSRPNTVEPTTRIVEIPDSASHQYPESNAERTQQRESEPITAEELKAMQEAALKRFEERHRQEAAATSAKQVVSDPDHSEHLRSLCSEWGATMDCNR
jgi:serine/threonine protein kinase